MYKTIIGVVVVIILIILLVGACGSLASENSAQQALETQGFTNIHLIKKHIFFVEFLGCGREDVARFDFIATNPRNQRVQVDVCEGWPFKGATIRYP